MPSDSGSRKGEDTEVRYSRDITRRATEVFLEDDAETLKRLVKAWKKLRATLRHELFVYRGAALDGHSNYEKINQNNFPAPMRGLMSRENLALGPIFVGLSIWLKGYAPTVYVPVPYEKAHLSPEMMSSLLTADRRSAEILCSAITERERFTREFSHALTNISFSVRMGDRPYLGWVAYAHETGTVLYIPDVRTAESKLVTSAAREVEPHLGMSSVVYLPVNAESEDVAEAVLWLWSPSPGRWDHLKGDPIENAKGVFHFSIWDHLKHEVSNRFDWLKVTVRKEAKAQIFVEAQFFTLIQRLRDWMGAGGETEHFVFENKMLHHVPELMDAVYGNNPYEPAPIRDFLLDAIYGDARTLSLWALHSGELCLDGLRAFWQIPHCSKAREGSIWDLEEAVKRLDLTWKLDRISKNAATSLVIEAAKNAIKRAKTVSEVRVTASECYLTLEFVQTPTNSSQADLTGSDAAFRRYYATRRGLIVPKAGEKSSGMGLALQSMLGAHLGVYQKLFITPSGDQAVSKVSIPVRWTP